MTVTERMRPSIGSKNWLQKKLGMEAGLYVPSGTMGNACALFAHTRSGDDVFFEERAHLFAGARGEFAVLNGVRPHPMQAEFGVIQPEGLEGAINSENVSQPSLLCIENTHNGSGGLGVGTRRGGSSFRSSEDTRIEDPHGRCSDF